MYDARYCIIKYHKLPVTTKGISSQSYKSKTKPLNTCGIVNLHLKNTKCA